MNNFDPIFDELLSDDESEDEEDMEDMRI